jgi:hypothetical protein
MGFFGLTWIDLRSPFSHADRGGFGKDVDQFARRLHPVEVLWHLILPLVGLNRT